MATIVDVARRAVVSVYSLAVINSKEWVSAGLRARVRDAIEAVDYRPNAIARSLKRGRSSTIGMLVADISNPFFADVFQVASRLAYRHGYSVILASSAEDPDHEAEYIRVFSERMIDGLILAPAACNDASLELLAEARMPIVLVDRILAKVCFDAVTVENRTSTRSAIEHMLSLGHRRIVLFPARLLCRPPMNDTWATVMHSPDLVLRRSTSA